MELKKQQLTAPMSGEEAFCAYPNDSEEQALNAIRIGLVARGWNRSLANIRALFLRPQIRALLRSMAEEIAADRKRAKMQDCELYSDHSTAMVWDLERLT